MSFGLDWVNDLALWIGELFPRWELLEPTQGGVRFGRKGSVTILEHGVYWWWPVCNTVQEIDIRRQPLSVSQRLTTKDDITVFVKTVVVYRIVDVEKALVETRDFDETIAEIAQKLTIKPITSRTFEQTRTDMSETNDMRNEVTRAARSLLSDYGVEVIDAYVSDFVETRMFSHDGEGIVVDGDDE